jgi:hypothetical protein
MLLSATKSRKKQQIELVQVRTLERCYVDVKGPHPSSALAS